MTRQLLDIPVEHIDRDPAQPRQLFDEVALAELADSIRAHGVIQPIEVEVTADGRYRLHHGERRWRASKLAGLVTIPAVVAPARSAEEALVRGMIENLHREDLNPIEEAKVYRRLIDDMGWTRIRIARETGRSGLIISQRLAWLKLEPEIQKLVAVGNLHRDGRLADALLILPPEVRVPLAERLAAQALTFKASLAACQRAAEKIAQRAEAAEAGRARHVAVAAAVPSPNGRGANGHVANGRVTTPATPMLALGAANARVTDDRATVADAAEAMCRACNIRPRGNVIPAWELVEEEARRTCAACQKRDGVARLDVCRLCPGVELVKRLLTASGATTGGAA